MKKFLLGLIVGIVLAGLMVAALLLAVVWIGQPSPTIKDHSTLVLGIQGPIPERAPMVLPFPVFESRAPVTVQEIWTMLDEAAHDPKISAMVMVPRNVSGGWAKMQEIRDSLLKYKTSGKPLIAYLRRPGAREYYLASAAGKIYLSPEDLLNLKGLRIEAVYLRQTLDKLGIEAEIEHAGKYKDAGDTLTRSTMSPETREVLDSVLDGIYAHLIEAIAEGRDKTPQEIRQILDEGPFLGPRAEELGLIDGLRYEDEVYDELKSELGQDEITRLSHHTYNRHLRDGFGGPGHKQIAMVVASGSILGGSGDDGFGGDEAIWSRDFIRLLRQVRKNDAIGGVILRIDSPGGDAIASDEILREVRLLSGEKPMVISMSDVAASGGYYMAMTGDPIVAYPDTFTGSIGVIYGKINLKGLYDKIGLKKEILTRGRFAAIDSDYVPLGAAEREKLREGIDAVYENFLTRVSEGRRRTRDQIEPLAQGRVWLGVQALENGLVDELGGLDKALALVKEKAGIPKDEKVHWVTYPKRRSFLKFLMDQGDESLFASEVLQLVKQIDISVWRQGGILRLMPYRLEIR